jgi:DNA-binding NarL/FixJ family response regulator|tara:strand:+ start:839 stop:1474 length:636 start_codon:yes stop_codon:yes gene_type:complete
MTDSIRILIIEDNQNYLNSLKQALTLLDGVEYSDGYGSFEAFRDAAPAAPDCILLDINLPGISGLDALIELKQMMPATEVIILTQNDDYPNVLTAIQRGASGYIIKGGSVKGIHQAILDVNHGASVIDPRLSRIVLTTLAGTKTNTKENPLSDREAEVLKSLADGLTKKEVAEVLSLSYHTIDLYTRNIYEKLQSPNIAAAIATAIRKGLI